MPSYSSNAFTLDKAHAAATAAGFKPSRLGNRGRFSFNSRACHVGGDNPNGCWATERDGRVYFHCHKHTDGKGAWLEAQRRITAHLGLPEYRVPGPSNGNGQPHQVCEWTYHNPRTGESAVQVVERYDGACWREDCGDRFAHKHPWLRRDEKFQQQPTDGFLLLEYQPAALKTRENAICESPVNGNSCNVCNSCSRTAALNRQTTGDGTGNWGVICEGETTAESAAACGWRAFSYQGGANGAGRADYSPVAGMTILIAPDHDRPGMKAALTGAIRCLEAGAREVRIMPTDAFRRRGEDLADLDSEQRARVIEAGWFSRARELGPLILELAVHNLTDRCQAATKRPLVAATKQEHFDDHVIQVWSGIFEREERGTQPSLFVNNGRLVYLTAGAAGDLEITEHTGDSIAILAASSVFWYLGYQEKVLVSEPEPDADLDTWQTAAAELDAAPGHEQVWVSREVRQRKDEPTLVNYVLHTPKRHHPQRTVTNALLINLPEDLPQLDAVMSHPFLNGASNRLVIEEGYHPEERVYLQNHHPFTPVSVQQAVAELDDLFFDFPFADEKADRSNLYAAIVTRICHRSYAMAPMFMFDKPKSGTGATLLASLVGLLTTGKHPERVSYCNGEMVEFEERAVTDAEAAQHPFVQWWWDTHQSNPVTMKDLAPVALGDPNDDDSEGMLKVKGTNDRIRRINLSKLVNTWLDQTYELEGVTVRVVSGPRYANRYATWLLQVPDSKVGAFPLLPGPEPEAPLHALHILHEIHTPPKNESADSRQKRACRSCGRPLLPDEQGPDCQDCRPGGPGSPGSPTDADRPGHSTEVQP